MVPKRFRFRYDTRPRKLLETFVKIVAGQLQRKPLFLSFVNRLNFRVRKRPIANAHVIYHSIEKSDAGCRTYGKGSWCERGLLVSVLSPNAVHIKFCDAVFPQQDNMIPNVGRLEGVSAIHPCYTAENSAQMISGVVAAVSYAKRKAITGFAMAIVITQIQGYGILMD